MVLSGTLREYILADVLQLLTQQKITGMLILNNGRTEGHILFRNGSIVGAVREHETFLIKLFYYLTEVLQLPRNKVREIFTAYDGKTAELVAYLENRGILSRRDIELYATNVIIDVACSLFLWKSGNYRFESMAVVDHLVPAGIEIPVENVVMEAMRRIDEWNQMRSVINEETLFIQTGKIPAIPSSGSPIEDPSLYIYHRLDGTVPVKILLTDAFLTEYKIYETLYQLWRNENIQPLSESVTKSIQAAIKKKEQDQYTASILPSLFSILVTIVIILLIILFAWIFRDAVFSKKNISSSLKRTEAPQHIATEHLKEAHLFLQTRNLDTEEENGLPLHPSITRRDLRNLSQMRDYNKPDTGYYNKLNAR